MAIETVIDSKGRVVLPKKVRGLLGLREGSRLKVDVEGRRIMIYPPVKAEDFIKEMEGYVKEEIIPAENPMMVKKIWEPKVARRR
jgi:AbrB family looped-hinge helix DNA binding protein